MPPPPCLDSEPACNGRCDCCCARGFVLQITPSQYYMRFFGSLDIHDAVGNKSLFTWAHHFLIGRIHTSSHIHNVGVTTPSSFPFVSQCCCACRKTKNNPWAPLHYGQTAVDCKWTQNKEQQRLAQIMKLHTCAHTCAVPCLVHGHISSEVG